MLNDAEIKQAYANGARCRADKEGDCDCDKAYRGSKKWCQLLDLHDEEYKALTGEEYERRY